MSGRFEAQVAPLNGDPHVETFEVKRLYNFGSATRSPDTAVAHQEEVAKSGIHIAFDVPAPRIYPIGVAALVQDDEIFVQTDRTSGEVEIVVHVADQVYVGVGSDHTDRALETVSIPGSKQACPNHIGPALWPYEEIRETWDDCILRSWVDGRLYQDVGVAAFIRPEDMLSILRERVGGVPDRDFTVFGGTIVSVDKALGFGTTWRYEIDDPTNNRSISAEYRVTDILSEVSDEFRVPFFNPTPAGA